MAAPSDFLQRSSFLSFSHPQFHLVETLRVVKALPFKSCIGEIEPHFRWGNMLPIVLFLVYGRSPAKLRRDPSLIPVTQATVRYV